MRNFDNDTIRMINTFENITGAEVRDCICSDVIYFLVNPGKMAKAIGKNGQNIKIAEKMLKKSIKIFEWSEDCEQFIRNMIPSTQKIDINNDKATITIGNENRGAVFGKKGCNIKAIREFLIRNSHIKELKIL
ncbi:MAG: NusA-like transcription termination signal-binding factor [Candidatus Aenigmatarchaeota archaeon]